MGEEKPKSKGVWSSVKPFVNGGVSGMSATCVIQPIDMIKVVATPNFHSVHCVLLLITSGVRAWFF